MLFVFSDWLTPFSMATSCLVSPLVIGLCRRKSTRLTAVMGGLVIALGCLFTSFANQFSQLYLSYGLTIGSQRSALQWFFWLHFFCRNWSGHDQRTSHSHGGAVFQAEKIRHGDGPRVQHWARPEFHVCLSFGFCQVQVHTRMMHQKIDRSHARLSCNLMTLILDERNEIFRMVSIPWPNCQEDGIFNSLPIKFFFDNSSSQW